MWPASRRRVPSCSRSSRASNPGPRSRPPGSLMVSRGLRPNPITVRLARAQPAGAAALSRCPRRPADGAGTASRTVGHDLVGGHAVGGRLVAEHQPVAQWRPGPWPAGRRRRRWAGRRAGPRPWPPAPAPGRHGATRRSARSDLTRSGAVPRSGWVATTRSTAWRVTWLATGPAGSARPWRSAARRRPPARRRRRRRRSSGRRPPPARRPTGNGTSALSRNRSSWASGSG